MFRNRRKLIPESERPGPWSKTMGELHEWASDGLIDPWSNYDFIDTVVANVLKAVRKHINEKD